MTEKVTPYEFRFLNFKGLSSDPGDWLRLRQTTVIVGRNNVGKSAIIDALRFTLDKKTVFLDFWNRNGEIGAKIHIRQSLNENDLKSVFPQNTSGGQIGGSHWEYGKRYIGSVVTREMSTNRALAWTEPPIFTGVPQPEFFLANVLTAASLPEATVFGVSAERDVNPEPLSHVAPVEPNGKNLTNLVRAFLYNVELDANKVEIALLGDLNEIYESDFKFSRISAQLSSDGNWEIYLHSETSGIVRLSQCGSSLKSIFIIVATLRLNTLVGGLNLTESVFYVEEPENNLHPSLLRRLLLYLDGLANNHRFHLIVTTHSAAAIDWASRSSLASIYHVTMGLDGAQLSFVQEYSGTRKIIDDLDIRASEILQANGIIWVEGPSDRIYVNRWIELFSKGALVEGQHYSTMFYGGKLLSHLSCDNPGGQTEFINLLKMNRNSALLMDSDRRALPGGKFRSKLNKTKMRILAEARLSSSFVWTTFGREIENYISSNCIRIVSGHLEKIDNFASVVDALKVRDKISLSRQVCEVMQISDLEVLDLHSNIKKLCSEIYKWNGVLI